MTYLVRHYKQRRLFRDPPPDRRALLEYLEKAQARVTTHFQTLNASGPIQVILIACSAGKLDHDAPAKDLYTGQLFRKSRAYAEKTEQPYFILSALHGLLEPTKVIGPYNYTLKKQRLREREAWGTRVVDSIVWHVPQASTITLLAGSDYADPIESKLKLKGFKIDRPLKGLGIGQQQQKLIELTRAIP